MKRISGIIEIGFDSIYLVAASVMGILLVATSSLSLGDTRFLAGVMALLLAFGDSFHLVPRILSAASKNKDNFTAALGRGKQITSITMTIFYILLWHIGMTLGNVKADFWFLWVYFLAIIRIILCLMPQNEWTCKTPSPQWGIFRNIPFFMLGLTVSGLYLATETGVNGFQYMWILILLSFAFYLPVVLFAHKKPMVGMLMLPKTCVYLWILALCLAL